MKKLLYFTFILSLLAFSQENAEAQIFKRNKDKTKKEKKNKKDQGYQGFAVPQAPLTPEQQEKQLTTGWRKVLNMFNFSVEQGFGYFSYQNPLEGVSVVRDPAGDLLYITNSGESAGQGPVTGFTNWFNGLTSIDIARIDDDAQVVRTDTTDFVYRNNGRINPFTLRLSFSVRKVDKQHLKRTGERRLTDDELLRIGGGISFGKLRFRNSANTQEVDPRLGSFNLPVTELSTTKLFGSITYNAYRYGDLSLLLDISGGVWKTKSNTIDESIVNYDPFFNFGVIFEKKISKYFKVYLRPSFEMRQYALSNEALSVNHRFSVFSIDIGALIKYPTYPRNKFKAHRVQMEHIFNGKIYRGRSIFQPQNPRTGQFGKKRKKKVRLGGN